MLKKIKNSKDKGFTLIELLVVIAIIGILSGVVLVSVNAAREKGKIAFIKSTLKNMQSQAEITYTETGSYASLFNSSTGVCVGSLSLMYQSLIEKGIYVRCFSMNSSYYNDFYLRFGITALIYKGWSGFEAWSSDQSGVVKWYEKDVTTTGSFVTGSGVTMDWNTATNACSFSGGRLPSVEQFGSFLKAWSAAHPYIGGVPVSFYYNKYFSSTVIPNQSIIVYGGEFDWDTQMPLPVSFNLAVYGYEPDLGGMSALSAEIPAAARCVR